MSQQESRGSGGEERDRCSVFSELKMSGMCLSDCAEIS